MYEELGKTPENTSSEDPVPVPVPVHVSAKTDTSSSVEEDASGSGSGSGSKPLTDYQKFMREIRPVIVREMPGLSPQEILKEIGRRWKEVQKEEPKQKTSKKKDTPVEDGESKKKPSKKKDTPVEDGEPKKKPSKKKDTPVEDGEPKKITGEAEVSSSENLRISTEASSSISIDTEETTGKGRRVNIPKYIKTLVWNTYIGDSKPNGYCASCQVSLIRNTSFHCGHVIAQVKGGDDTLGNLRPICSECNTAMGTMSMREFVKKYFGRELE
jgi:hypothetical protein